MDNEHIHSLAVRCHESAKSLELLHMILEGVLNVLLVPLRRLGLVKMIEYVEDEIVKSRFVEGVSECFRDKLSCLRPVHLISNR
jgi:hypothetical protein